jgi:HK97 family phage prohead protease
MTLTRLQTRLEIKAAGDDGTIEGHGAVFGNLDDQKDLVAPGAFKASLGSGRKVKMLWQHDPHQPIGVWDEVTEDNVGLRVKGRLLLDTTLGREAHVLLKHGAVDGLSIGYRTVAATYDEKTGVRTIKEAELWEVSVVTFPANRNALVAAVKTADEIDAMSVKDLERRLREAGFSAGEAKAIVHRLQALGRQREADDAKASRAAHELERLARTIRGN